MADGICYGATDLPLAEDAAEVADRLRPLLPDAPVFSSPLARCRELAQALHPEPAFDDRLKELDFGDWEMRPWESLDCAALDAWAADPLGFAPPGGESVAELRVRVRSFLEGLSGDVIVVAHAGVMKLCAAELAGVPSNEWFGMRFHYASVTLIEKNTLAWRNRTT